MKDTRKLFVIGVIASLLIAVVVAQFASSSPDGLEFVAEQEGFADTAAEHDLADSPLADYGENLTDDAGLNTAVAGFVGVLLTLAIGYGVFWLARRTNSGDQTSATN
jgi:cobalt/nickel transport system permease protein